MTTYSNLDKHVTPLNLPTKAVVYGGAVGGIVAGLVLAAVSMILNGLQGEGIFAPVYWIAATFYGESALEGGFFTLLVGLVFHIFNSAILGIVFAFITSKIHSRGALLATGVLFGMVVWAVMTYVALPMVNQVMLNQVQENSSQWFINHIIFGLALSAVPYFEKKKAKNSVRASV